jgi:hypothetical protein
MQFPAKHPIAVLMLCGLAVQSLSAQQEIPKHPTGKNVTGDEARVASGTLTADDGLAVIAAALDSSVHLRAQRDCSHLVHAIYDRAGFPYGYVDSSNIYIGTPNFKRVAHPQPGDLVVWRGHVGGGYWFSMIDPYPEYWGGNCSDCQFSARCCRQVVCCCC